MCLVSCKLCMISRTDIMSGTERISNINMSSNEGCGGFGSIVVEGDKKKLSVFIRRAEMPWKLRC